MLIQRDELSEQELKEALDECAREPIHIPGAVQPHGVMIVLAADNTVQQVSANIDKLLGVAAPDCLGRNLSEILEPVYVDALLKVKTEGALQPVQSTVVRKNGREFDAIAHQSGASLIVELEEIQESAPRAEKLYDTLRNFAIGMHKAKGFTDIFEHVVAGIREVSGFDRVKLYRFDEDWHGEVVAESRADFMPSYKGLHFPASDIPEQARKLYMKSYLRLIASTTYKPVPLVPPLNPATKAPLDMSLSVLRSVSPVHIQYLENINVRASMSVSIIQNGHLWGLIACHHNAPLHVPYQVRNICEIMGHIFSAQLSTMEDFSKREDQDRRDALVRKLSVALDSNPRIDRLMAHSHALAREALSADGLAVKTFVHVLQYGDVPPQDVLGALMDWLKQKGDDEIFYTDDAQKHFPDVPVLQSLRGGILAVPIRPRSQDYIVWFPNAIVKEVSWAGNPEKSAEETKAGYRLTPRSSFELWKQEVRHRSAVWSDGDVKTARAVAAVLLESEKLNAEQANVAKTEFLANMSHEIRTPMNVIIGLSRILAESRPLTERQKQFVKTLQISADGLLILINDLLDISKIESRSLELEEIPFSLNQLLQEVISMMSVKAVEKGILVTLKEASGSGKVYVGDPGRMRQIILNLCSNALKFTEKVSIDLTVHAEASGDPDIEKVCITIRDTGIGIAPDKLDLIFHKFVQADAAVSRKYGGTGLGLAITKMLAEAMGGEVNVTSREGEGSEFVVCVFLKVASQGKAETPASPVMERPWMAERPLVLLVEDYEPNILVASTFLENGGFDCHVARSGIEAVERVKAGHYFAVLMDVQMPGLSGLEATQMIREHEQKNNLRRIPIIGMTAHALAGDRERCLAAGMDEYLSKPVSGAALEGKLELFKKARQ